MAPVTITKAVGLNTQPNELETPAGSLAVAENVVISRDGVIEVDRGFEDLSTNLPDFTPSQLLSIGGTAYLHLNNGIWYLSGSSWERKEGASLRTVGFYGIVADTSNDILYIADGLSFCVWKFVISSGQLSVLAGLPGTSGTTDGTGVAARFTSPRDLWYDGSANLYVADNHGIRKVVISTRAVTTVCGSVSASGDTNLAGAAARFNNLWGIGGDGTYLYVNDYTNTDIKKIDLATYTPADLVTSAAPVQYGKVAVSGGYVYWPTTGNAIKKADSSTGATTTFFAYASAVKVVFISGSYLYTKLGDNVIKHTLADANTYTQLGSLSLDWVDLCLDSVGDFYSVPRLGKMYASNGYFFHVIGDNGGASDPTVSPFAVIQTLFTGPP